MLPVMDPGLELMRRTLAAIAPLGEREWNELSPVLRARRFDSGSHLQRAGDPCRSVFFLTAGLVREYYSLSDGTERVRSFSGPGRFTAAYADFILARPSEVAIQALDETYVLDLPVQALLELRRASPAWESINHRLLEQMYVIKEKRECQFLTMSATDRYRRLHEDFPGIEETVSQYHLASYIGITPVALSRIRRRLRDAEGARSTATKRETTAGKVAPSGRRTNARA